MIRDFRFADREQLASKLADEVAGTLAEAVADAGKATLVVSGGTTPAPFFRQLSRRKLDWNRVTVTLADERWVAHDDDASNERLVRQLLMRDEAAAATLVGWKRDAASVQTNADLVDGPMSELRPFDVVVLGMGTDGHTASLFPDAPELAAAIDLDTARTVIALEPPSAAQPRLSLTARALLDARRLFVHIVGVDKAAVLDRARRDAVDGDEPPSDLPISVLLRQVATSDHHIDVYWAP